MQDTILSAKVEPGDPQKVEVRLLQSSGDAVTDQQTLKTASKVIFDELPIQKLPVTYALDFDLLSGKVNVQQK